MELYTTLNKIRGYDPCEPEFGDFVKSLNGRYGDDEDIPFSEMLKHTGIENVLWSLNTITLTELQEKMLRLFGCDCAEHVLHIFEAKYPGDPRPRNAIATARRYANGLATKEELDRAVSSAWARGSTYSVASRAAYWACKATASTTFRACRAANSATYGNEREWQTEKFMEYLKGKKEIV